MHELGLCRSIVRVVEANADDRPVTVVHVRVGELKAVVPDTMSFCWGLATEGTAYAGSVLDVEHVPATLTCRRCAVVSPLVDLRMECGACGSDEVDLASGEELDVTSLELGG